MISKAKQIAQYKYDKINTQQVMLKLNKTSDADIIKKLSDVDNKQGYIKNLVRSDLRGFNKVLSTNDISCLVIPVAKKYQINSIHLFGSYSRGEANSDSDIDLLIDGGNYKGLFEYAQLVEAFETSLNKHVDIVTNSSLINPRTKSVANLKSNILKDMILIYEKE